MNLSITPSETRGMPEDGDGVVVLKPDGSAYFLTVGLDMKGIIESAQRGDLTAEQAQAFEVARKAMALAVAANNETLMDIIYQVAENPDVVDLALLGAVRN